MLPPRANDLFFVYGLGQTLATLRAPRLQHVLARGGGAALTKSMFAFGLDFTGLKRSFHRDILVENFEIKIIPKGGLRTFLPSLVNGKKNSFQDRRLMFFEKKGLAKMGMEI